MVARTRRSTFTITFWRADEPLDARTAATGEHALRLAMLMLCEQSEVQDGDRLTVREDPVELPEVSRSGHYSG